MISLHPASLNGELYYYLNALKEIILNYDKWKKDYIFNPKKERI